MLPLKAKVKYIGDYYKDQMLPDEVGEVTGKSMIPGWSQVEWPSGRTDTYPDRDLQIVGIKLTDEPIGLNPTTKESKMKKCISEVYEKTSEAVLVEKYADTMGIRNDNFLSQCVIKSNKAAFLAEAKRLEAESK